MKRGRPRLKIEARQCEQCHRRFRPERKGQWRKRRFCGLSCALTFRHATTHYRVGWVKPGLDAKVHPTMLDIAWGAGIFEGEGWCQGKARSGTTNGTTTHAAVGQKYPWLCHRLKALFGGSIYSHGRGRESSWNIHGARARGFLMTVFTFLSPHRRAQVRKALAA